MIKVQHNFKGGVDCISLVVGKEPLLKVEKEVNVVFVESVDNLKVRLEVCPFIGQRRMHSPIEIVDMVRGVELFVWVIHGEWNLVGRLGIHESLRNISMSAYHIDPGLLHIVKDPVGLVRSPMRVVGAGDSIQKKYEKNEHENYLLFFVLILIIIRTKPVSCFSRLLALGAVLWSFDNSFLFPFPSSPDSPSGSPTDCIWVWITVMKNSSTSLKGKISPGVSFMGNSFSLIHCMGRTALSTPSTIPTIA